MTIGENIRRIRIQKGMTQKQVGMACGTVDAVIRTYELGKANPKPATVAKIAKALGVSPAELYGMDGTGQHDPSMVLAVYQSESGGVIDEDAVYLHRIVESLKKLNSEGKEDAARRVEELTHILGFKSPQPVADALAELTEEEQGEILSACHSLREAKLEKAMMEQKPRKSADALRSNAAIMAEQTGILADVILEALDRAGLFDSSK